MNTNLFDAFKIKNNLTLKNRFSMAATYTGYDGHSKEYRDFYLERAKGGLGMLIIPQSTGDPLESWSNPDFYLGFKPLLDEAHKYGTKVILQVYEPIDDINSITKEELYKIPAKFAEAAKSIKESGFDGLEIHGAHYMPFMSLLSPTQNRRDDEYGGSFTNRTRLQVNTVKAIKKEIGDFPLFYRLSATDYVENGVELYETEPFSQMLEEAGIDCLDISAGTGESPEMKGIFPKANIKPGCFSYLAKAIKKKVNIPVITVGRINSLEVAQNIVDNNEADIISYSRPLIADANLINKMKDGNEDKIIKCLFCNKGCLKDTLEVGKPINCFINPMY